MNDQWAEQPHSPHVERQAGERMRLLKAVGDELHGVELLRFAVQQAVADLAGLGGMLHLRLPGVDGLCLVASSGLPPALTHVWRQIAWDDDAAAMLAVREGACVWHPAVYEAMGGHAPSTPVPPPRSGSRTRPWDFPAGTGILAVPLIAPDRPLGALSVLTTTPGEPTADQQVFVRTLACWVAGRLESFDAPGVPQPEKQPFASRSRKAGPEWNDTDVTDHWPPALERARVERTAAGQAARMLELTAALAEAITVQDVVKAVADRVLPPFGATGLVILFLEGDHLRPAGAVGYAPEFVEEICHFPMTDEYPIPRVIQERAPLFISSVEEYARCFPTWSDLPARAHKKAWAFLPMIVSGHPFGSCVISFDHPREFSGEERSLLTALSGLVAQALERARLYDAEHNRAQQLQHALLPRTLPTLPAVTAAARYLPAAKDMEVGGDWYDVIPLSSERVALVIGDVMGHGVTEAATMGRLRTAVHTLADLELPPDELLTHLNDLITDLGEDFYATCLYAVYDPTTRLCSFSRAGHPPPAILYPDGTVRFLKGEPNPPLGAATPPFDIVETHVPEGTVLILYTDGLVESATRDIDQGMALLAETVAGIIRRPPCRHRDHSSEAGQGCRECMEVFCDTLLTALLSPQQATNDDSALLIARTHLLGGDDIAFWSLPVDPRAAGQARSLVRDQLEIWHLDDLSMTTELLVSELIGNVVRHARGPVQLRLLRGRSLVCEVSDGSLTTPRIRRASDTDEGGRGLQLVAALSHRWGTRYTATGKCIWTEQSLPSA
ncbi:SpoIIE family protein phosphatase [Nonomuraea purpurea]|uniref:SpoIIE family protein phosphatase n=1 Tax=Nonomuraea purpurea TaxID=1849276 RepID=A0ABV8G496_9ACTN